MCTEVKGVINNFAKSADGQLKTECKVPYITTHQYPRTYKGISTCMCLYSENAQTHIHIQQKQIKFPANVHKIQIYTHCICHYTTCAMHIFQTYMNILVLKYIKICT